MVNDSEHGVMHTKKMIDCGNEGEQLIDNATVINKQTYQLNLLRSVKPIITVSCYCILVSCVTYCPVMIVLLFCLFQLHNLKH